MTRKRNLGTLSLTVFGIVLINVLPAPAAADGISEVNSCDSAIPVTPVMVGQGGSTFQLYQSRSVTVVLESPIDDLPPTVQPSLRWMDSGLLDTPDLVWKGSSVDVPLPTTREAGTVYATWSMATNSITNGADGWIFGVEVEGSRTSPQLWHHRSMTCVPVASLSDTGPFRYLVHGGAWGTSGNWGCTTTYHWEFEAGIEVSMTGPSGHVDFRFGESRACSDGGEYDAESLFDDVGEADLACLLCLVPRPLAVAWVDA